jgi:catechol 2,3-dioxygenase-like lactoylglutathione lyase family enzyme
MHLELVALIVDEYDSAIEFFVRRLGFELVEGSPSTTSDGRPKRWVVVRPTGAATGLLLARGDDPDQANAVGRQFAGRIGSVSARRRLWCGLGALRSAGIEFLTSPRREAYGQVAVFAHVAGNRWDLLGPP